MSNQNEDTTSDSQLESRVSDLIKQDQPVCDPSLEARLAQQFGTSGPPQASSSKNQALRPRPRTLSPQEQRQQSMRKAATHADPALLTRLEHQGKTAANMATLHKLRTPPPVLAVEAPLRDFDVAEWGLRSGSEELYRERPPDIDAALEQNSPQAVLRDLYRPVSHFPAPILKLQDLGIDRTGSRARHTVDETMRASYTVRIDQAPLAKDCIAKDMANLRNQLHEPWDNIQLPTRPQLDPQALAALDHQWFVLSGGTDTNQ